MKWSKLNNIDQINQIDQESHGAPVLIYKHSTACPVSASMLELLDNEWPRTEQEHNPRTYLLDLLTYRDVSDAVAKHYDVVHESPQVLIIEKGKVVLEQSHLNIRYTRLHPFMGNS